jgi:hypothetical protein
MYLSQFIIKLKKCFCKSIDTNKKLLTFDNNEIDSVGVIFYNHTNFLVMDYGTYYSDLQNYIYIRFNSINEAICYTAEEQSNGYIDQILLREYINKHPLNIIELYNKDSKHLLYIIKILNINQIVNFYMLNNKDNKLKWITLSELKSKIRYRIKKLINELYK